MKIKNIFWAVISILALVVPALSRGDAYAASAPTVKPTEAPATRLSRREILEKLNLTTEQKQALRKNRAAFRKKIAEIDGQLRVKKVELENEMEKPEPDQVKLKEIADGIGDLQGQKVSEKIKAELEVEKSILVPPQLELLKKLQGKESPASEEIL